MKPDEHALRLARLSQWTSSAVHQPEGLCRNVAPPVRVLWYLGAHAVERLHPAARSDSINRATRAFSTRSSRSALSRLESAALPLRHSPSPSSARAGANHSKDVPVVGRLLLAGALGARAHADRQRLLRTHHLPKTLLHERFRSMEVDRPTHTEHPVVEESIRFRVPVRAADALPGRRPEVIRHNVEHFAVPGALWRRFGELGRDSGRNEAKCNNPNKTTDSA